VQLVALNSSCFVIYKINLEIVFLPASFICVICMVQLLHTVLVILMMVQLEWLPLCTICQCYFYCFTILDECSLYKQFMLCSLYCNFSFTRIFVMYTTVNLHPDRIMAVCGFVLRIYSIVLKWSLCL